MQTINLTLKIPNKEDLNLLLKFIKRLGIETLDIQPKKQKLQSLSLGAKKSNGKAMAAALRNLASTGSMNRIEDPMQWQREMRQDKPLFGRK